MKIYVTGLIAYETAERLYREDPDTLRARFPAFFLRDFEKLSEELTKTKLFLDSFCIEKNTKNYYSSGIFKAEGRINGDVYIREITEGGLFAALWAACADLEKELQPNKSLGCRTYLEKIPVDQHILEILEYYKENPYEVSSRDSYLLIPVSSCDGAEYMDSEALAEIGEITGGKDRVVIYKERQRFLTPPARQAKDLAARKGS